MKNQTRYCSSFIPDNEIIHNTLYLDGELFVRYYHQKVIPTRYFFSNSGKVYSEITRNFVEPENYSVIGKDGNYHSSNSKRIRMYVRVNNKVKRITRKLESVLDSMFNK